MNLVLSIFGSIVDIIEWFIGYGQRQIGKEEQQNVDIKEINAALVNELDAANEHVSALDRLQNGKF